MAMKEELLRRYAALFPRDFKASAKLCRQLWPEECGHILRVAGEVCRNQFVFDLKCDMEKTTEPVTFPEGRIKWDYMPAGDAEFIYQFNRHRYFICLGQAYQMTGDENYARKFDGLVRDWTRTQKRTPETEKTTWRVLESGFRGEFWVKAMAYFTESAWVTEETARLFFGCLREQAVQIMEMHSPYRYISNWGVIENHGLFQIGMVHPDRDFGERCIRTALEHLETEARMQVMGDGCHWEQSPSYHNEVLRCLLDVLIFAERGGIRTAEVLRRTAHAMARADLASLKPNGRQLLMGDSDDDDIRDILARAAWFFKDPELKSQAQGKLGYEDIWEFGAEAAGAYRSMEAKGPAFTDMACRDSGNYYLRSGWGEADSLLHLHCGTMGAGHGHSDQLHVDLYANGEDILTDSGRYTYVDGPDRREFKDPSAHNTITVDGKPFTVYKDSWECSKLCQPVKQEMAVKEGMALAQGGHLGYLMGPGDGVYISRRVLRLRPDLFLIADACYSGGSHVYEQHWHFSERGRVRLAEGGAAFAGEKAGARLWFLGRGLEARLETSRISRFYNQCAKRDCIRAVRRGTGFTSFLTVIWTGKTGQEPPFEVREVPVRSALKGIEYPPQMAQAVGIRGEETDFIVIFCHQEVNSPTDLVQAEDCMGFGNVIAFDRRRERIAGNVLWF